MLTEVAREMLTNVLTEVAKEVLTEDANESTQGYLVNNESLF